MKNEYIYFDDVTHFAHLKKSYNKVGRQTWKNSDFNSSALSISRSLFSKESLELRKPKPKRLEVYALLSGLSFSKKITDKLIHIQQDIEAILGDSLKYWVLPSNFGVEYCVFKWPEESWKKEWAPSINKELLRLNRPSFQFHINGIQINPDGCVIAKGYDEDGGVFRTRDHLKTNLKFLPKRQSGWAHIPMGRILEPIGVEKFLALESLINKISDISIVSDEIDSIKFVHESRWYMEEKNILQKLRLG